MDCKHNATSYSSDRQIKCMSCGKIIPAIYGDSFYAMLDKYKKDGGDINWLIGNSNRK